MAAAAARKLQKEIDTTLKKVEEQRQEFSDVWEEANNAGATHREKLGEELKRCINKLQRSRVQIREWIAAEKTEQKTMDRLEESRRRIESDMQRFKEFERELKTKAYSTQALLKEEDMDVLCVEKKRNIEWLISQLNLLHELTDEEEAALESLTKKDESRRQELQQHDERHRWHIEKLERLLRSLQNDEVDMSELAVLKDTVEDYIERHKETDYYHDDALYDVFFIDEPCPATKDDADATPSAAASQKSEEFGSEIPTNASGKLSVSSTLSGVPPSVSAKKTKDRKKKEKETKVPVRTDLMKLDKKSSRGELAAEKEIEKKTPQVKEVKIQEDQLVGEAEEFICKICYVHVVGNGPFLTNCSHLFCGDCLSEWFQTHPECQSWAQRAKAAGPQRIVPCPVCKQNLNESTDLYPVCSTSMRSENLLLWRMLSSLKVMCKNHPKVNAQDGNCDWIGEYGTYQSHIKVCENKPIMNQGAEEGSVNFQREQGNSFSMTFKPAADSSAYARSSSSSATTALTETTKSPGKATTKSASNSGCEAKSSSTAPKAKAHTATPSLTKAQNESVVNSVATHVDGADADSSAQVHPVRAPSSSSTAAAEALSDRVLHHSVAPFQPNGSGQILVLEGDFVEVRQKHESGWSFGKVYSADGTVTEGWFPSWIVGERVHTQKEKEKSQQAAAAAAAAAAKTEADAATAKVGNVHRFHVQTAFTSTDPSQLSLAVGDLVEVIQQHASGWTFGRLLVSNKDGWFPEWVSKPPVA